MSDSSDDEIVARIDAYRQIRYREPILQSRHSIAHPVARPRKWALVTKLALARLSLPVAGPSPFKAGKVKAIPAGVAEWRLPCSWRSFLAHGTCGWP